MVKEKHRIKTKLYGERQYRDKKRESKNPYRRDPTRAREVGHRNHPFNIHRPDSGGMFPAVSLFRGRDHSASYPFRQPRAAMTKERFCMPGLTCRKIQVQ